MIRTLLLFGATGDLAGRYLLPALAAMRAMGELPDDFIIEGAALGTGTHAMFEATLTGSAQR